MKDTNMRNMNRVEQIWVSLMQHRPLSHMLLSSLFFGLVVAIFISIWQFLLVLVFGMYKFG